jgi:hypothetical protein
MVRKARHLVFIVGFLLLLPLSAFRRATARVALAAARPVRLC